MATDSVKGGGGSMTEGSGPTPLADQHRVRVDLIINEAKLDAESRLEVDFGMGGKVECL